MQGLVGRVAMALCVVVGCLFWSAPALAATFTVTNTGDSGGGSLRSAVTSANNDPGSTIVFAPGVSGFIDLLSPLAITQSVTIDGPGASVLELDGNGGSVQIMTVSSPATVAISGLRFAFGAAPDPGNGNRAAGGAINNDGTLTVSASEFDHNSAGGASQLSGPDSGQGQGGAISNAGTLTVRDSTFADNTAGGAGGAGPGSGIGVGGAIYNGTSASLTVSGSTFTANSVGGDGGGGQVSGEGLGGAIASDQPSSTTVSDSTLTANTAGGAAGAGQFSGIGQGGAVGFASNATATLTHDTIDANALGSAGGLGSGIDSNGTVSAVGTIVSGNSGASNCFGGANGITGRNSLEGPAGQTSCGFGLPSADPSLAPLADNGGPTETQKPGAGSPAIGAVVSGPDCLGTDQRGAGRTSGRCDVGAYEVAPPLFGVSIGGNAVPVATGPTTAFVDVAVANPDVEAGTVTLQYGTTTAYGNSAPTETLPPIGGAPFFYVASLSGLQPDTVYHSRLVATNPDGTTFGPDEQFTTASLPAPPSQPSQPSNTFTFGKAKVGPRGAITLAVNASDAGRFAAKATFTVITRKGHKHVKKTFVYGTASVRSTGRGTFKLVIGLRGLAARELKLLGSRQVTITVTFTPTGGTAAHKVSKVTVKRNRKGKYS